MLNGGGVSSRGISRLPTYLPTVTFRTLTCESVRVPVLHFILRMTLVDALPLRTTCGARKVYLLRPKALLPISTLNLRLPTPANPIYKIRPGRTFHRSLKLLIFSAPSTLSSQLTFCIHQVQEHLQTYHLSAAVVFVFLYCASNCEYRPPRFFSPAITALFNSA
ncbi:hypothetical protein HII31_13005 [Pseudocercospora fuligena]|uniref:Uncharacterized protein n=1 Tax=Pseudocercospora fuligena TaxID=685502 RepID=A0A8H6R5T9_9PEZI|nr:hypothetical protein HII31_13005 [Pseudocercospora fuligena]